MKKIKQIAGLLLIIFFTLSCCEQKVADISAEIEKANEALVTAMMNGDIDAIADMYTQDARILPQNGDVVEGQMAIKNSWAAIASMGISNFKLETISAEAYGNIAIEEGRYEMYIGDQLIDKGKYIVVWKKVDGKWKIDKDIPNTSMPLPVPDSE